MSKSPDNIYKPLIYQESLNDYRYKEGKRLKNKIKNRAKIQYDKPQIQKQAGLRLLG